MKSDKFKLKLDEIKNEKALTKLEEFQLEQKNELIEMLDRLRIK